MRSQIGDTDPRKNEETGVVQDEVKIAASSGCRPTDEPIPAGDLLSELEALRAGSQAAAPQERQAMGRFWI